MSNFDPCDALLDDEAERANEFIDVPEESKSYVRYVNVTWLFFTFLLYLYCEISLNIKGYFTNLAFNTFIRDRKQAFGTNIRKKMYTTVERIMKVCVMTLCQYKSGNVL